MLPHDPNEQVAAALHSKGNDVMMQGLGDLGINGLGISVGATLMSLSLPSPSLFSAPCVDVATSANGFLLSIKARMC